MKQLFDDSQSNNNFKFSALLMFFFLCRRTYCRPLSARKVLTVGIELCSDDDEVTNA